jgi:hypothetical protein
MAKRIAAAALGPWGAIVIALLHLTGCTTPIAAPIAGASAPVEANTNDALGRQNYWKSPDGREETWSFGGKQYMRFDGQLSVTDPARDSPECLVMLVDPKLTEAARDRSYNECWYKHNPDINPATNKRWRTAPPQSPSFGQYFLDHASP